MVGGERRLEAKDLLESWECEGVGNSSNYGEGEEDLKDFTVEVKELGYHLGIIFLRRVLTPPLIAL